MSIIRVSKHQHNFLVMDKTGLEDARLSFRAKGLLAYLLTKPNTWEVHVEHLALCSPNEGRAAIRSALRELEKAGYATRQKKPQTAQGRMAGWETIVYETPQSTDYQSTDCGSSVVGGESTDYQSTDCGSSVVGGHVATACQSIDCGSSALGDNIDLSKGVKKETHTHTPKSPHGETRASKASNYSAAFESFWTLYPSKTAKALTWRSWQKQQLATKVDVILADIQARLLHDEKWKRGIIPNPTTYLNQRRWEDEWQPPPMENPGQRKLVY